jgi:hypothetical protein
VRCYSWFGGAAGTPAINIISAISGADVHNDNTFTECKIVYSYGTALNVDSASTTTAPNNLYFTNCQFEG